MAMSLAGCGSGPACDAAALQAALDRASPGDEVRVGACRVEGSLRVPAGITLRGQGPESIIAPTGSTGVWLEPGEPPARVADLVVEARSTAGIGSASDLPCATPRPGAVSIERVEVRASIGWGIYLSCLSEAHLDAVSITGSIDADNFMSSVFTNVVGEPPAPDATCPVTPSGSCTVGDSRETTPPDCPSCGSVQQVCDPCERWATLGAVEGVALRDVTDARLADVIVRGFARVGVTAVDSGITWTGGAVEGQLGVGILSASSDLDMNGVTIAHTFESPWRLDPGVGAYVGAGSSIRSVDLLVEDNPRYGILHVGATASHIGLVARDNRDAALWVGASDSFELADASISGNEFAGVVLSACSNVSIRDSVIGATGLKTSNLASGSETGRVDAGDGIQLIATTSAVSIERTLLEANTRAGLVLDLGLGGDRVAFADVTVRGEGAQLGAVAGSASGTQLTAVAPGDGGWDTGITREGATGVNDAALTGTIDISGVTAPTELPIPSGAVGVRPPTE